MALTLVTDSRTALGKLDADGTTQALPIHAWRTMKERMLKSVCPGPLSWSFALGLTCLAVANEQGSFTTPSFVSFTDEERLIGEAAKNQAAMNPTNTIFDIK